MRSFAVPLERPRTQPSPTKTLALDVYERLRVDIRSGNLEPDLPLRMEWLKATYEVGATPLREALSRLAAEHLVTSEGKRGFRVAPVSFTEFSELTTLRSNIEHQAIELAARQGDDNWEATIVGCFYNLSKAPPVGQSNDIQVMEEREARHRDFHLSLIAACNSTWLLRIWSQVTEHQERCRRIAMRDIATPPKVAREIEEEHKAIMEAVLARDVAEADRLLRHHQRRTVSAVEAWDEARETG